MASPFDTSGHARGSSLQSIKTAQRAKDEEEKIKLRRRRGVLVMMAQFLGDSGYARTLESLHSEAGVQLAKAAPADNMDLVTIFSQFEEYYEFKFGKRPKFFRATDEGPSGAADLSMGVPAGRGPSPHTKNQRSSSRTGGGTVTPGPPSSAPPKTTTAGSVTAPKGPGGFGVVGHAHDSTNPLQPLPPIPPKMEAPKDAGKEAGKEGARGDPEKPGGSGVEENIEGFCMKGAAIKVGGGAEDEDPSMFHARSALRALPNFGSRELNELAALLHRDILDENPDVRFSDIAELSAAKQLLKEAVAMPMKYPELFRGIVRPWKGILLFGPPGTGKTMLAKAVATECRTTFFNISASTMVSKWRGDSEKLVRMLFDLAVHYAPSTIFLDELDSVMSARGGSEASGAEHEASRRMKTEFLVQMDGLAKRHKGDVVFVLAASNLPWDLDSAVLRRLEKRIHVGLPGREGRRLMLQQYLPRVVPGFDFDDVAARTQGFSGADVDVLCREATMRTVRVLIERLESEGPLDNRAIEPPKVTMEDLLESVEATRPSGTSIPLTKYSRWEADFGSTLSKKHRDPKADPKADPKTEDVVDATGAEREAISAKPPAHRSTPASRTASRTVSRSATPALGPADLSSPEDSEAPAQDGRGAH